MSDSIAIMWFRSDLRIDDNPALSAACQAGRLLPIYILEDEDAQDEAMGAASRVFLHHALTDLNQSLGGELRCFTGKAEEVIASLCNTLPVSAVHWNRAYEPWRMKRDTKIKKFLTSQKISAQSHKANLLWEPWEVTKAMMVRPIVSSRPFIAGGA